MSILYSYYIFNNPLTYNYNFVPLYFLEIRTLSGEPDYRSVNLTWGIEDTDATTENNITVSDGRSFTVYYCELQTWGAHRCKSKIVEDNEILDEFERQSRQYSTVIGNLRMATKYLFHVKLHGKPGEQKASGRADLSDNEIEQNGVFQGETIVIPTKGCKSFQHKNIIL